jgi:hypothetical protein
LDGEVKRLERREERRIRKARKGTTCGGCGGTVELITVLGLGDQTYDLAYVLKCPTELKPSSTDMSYATSPDIPAGESMKSVLAKLTQMKRDWEHEKMRLEGEREYLQSAADRLNQEVDQARYENDDTRGVLSVCSCGFHKTCADSIRRSLIKPGGQLQISRSSFN